MAAPAAQNAANPAPTPFEHELVKFHLEGHFHYTFTVDIELDLTDSKLDKKFKLEGVPLAGEWACACRMAGEDLVFEVLHGLLPVGLFGKRMRIELKGYWRDGCASNLLTSSFWEDGPVPSANPAFPGKSYAGHRLTIPLATLETAAQRSSGRFNVKTHRSYRLQGLIRSRGFEPTSEAETLIKRMPEVDLAATPHNVRLFFPALKIDLWSESSILSRSSPYFKALFASGFSENQTTCSGVHSSINSAAPPHVDAQDYADSDSETDELFTRRHPLRQQSEKIHLVYKQVNITSTAYTTYRAVLAYLRTGYIAFAPLSSTFFAVANAAVLTRASRIEAVVSTDPSLPYPASPKSAFRLAHLLELDDLQKLCLGNLKKQLTIDCAPYELFADTSVCYDDWRQVVLDFVADNCDAVTATSAWAEVTGKIKRDEIRGSGPIMLELFERKVPKTAQSCVAT